MKARLQRLSPFAILSLFVSFAAGGFISWQILNWKASSHSAPIELEVFTPQKGEAPEHPVLKLDSFRQRPLFHETRAPIRISAQPQTADAQTASVDFEFIGLLLQDGGDGFAFLKSQESPDLFIVSPGGTVEGWTVEEISRSELTLSRDRRRERLRLKSLQGSQPGVP